MSTTTLEDVKCAGDAGCSCGCASPAAKTEATAWDDCSGGRCRPAGERRVEGWAVKFDERDVQGDVFTAETAYSLEHLKSLPVYYDHGLVRDELGRRVGVSPIGTARIEARKQGLWAVVQLDEGNPASDRVWADLKAGRGGWFFSSGSTQRLVRRERGPGGMNFLRAWPLSELSITSTPVSRNEVRPARSAPVLAGATKALAAPARRPPVKAEPPPPMRLGGYAIRFNGQPAGPLKEVFVGPGEGGDYRVRTGDRMPVTYGRATSQERVGMATFDVRDEGVWAEVELAEDSELAASLWASAPSGRLSLYPVVSDGPNPGQGVRRRPGPDGWTRVYSYPIRGLQIHPTLNSDGDENALRPVTAASTKARPGFGIHIHTTRGRERDMIHEDFGFRSFGEFAQEVRQVCQGRRHGPGGLGRRLRQYEDDVKASGLSEFSGADGALLVPPAFAEGVWQLALQQKHSPLAWAFQSTTSTATYSRLAWVESSLAAGSRLGGIRAYRVEESTAGTKSTPKARRIEHSLNKLMIRVDATAELAEDSPEFEGWLYDAMAREMAYTIGGEMIQGTGAGQCLGVINSAACVTVNAESGQGANTLVALNFSKMWASLHPDARANAVWFLSPAADGVIHTLASTSSSVTYATPGEAAAGAAPYTILGRPAWPSHHCAALGSKGDVVLGSWANYEHVVRKGHPKFSRTIHMLFDSDQECFKCSLRNDGRPMHNQTVAGEAGQTWGSFVTLSASRT